MLQKKQKGRMMVLRVRTCRTTDVEVVGIQLPEWEPRAAPPPTGTAAPLLQGPPKDGKNMLFLPPTFQTPISTSQWHKLSRSPLSWWLADVLVDI